jgi:outer membrane biosynthesis protein TonB
MKIRLISFTSAFLLHLLLFAAFYLAFSKQQNQAPQTAIIDAQIIVSKHQDHEHVYRGEKSMNDLHDFAAKKPSQSNEHFHDLFEDKKSEKAEKEMLPLFNPLPKIPDDLRDEAFQSEAIARFYISEKGEVLKVELIKPCSNPKLNQLLLKSLKSWKFASANSASNQDIRVNFLVK